MNTAYTLIIRHCHNQLVARSWPDNMSIDTHLSYSQGDGVAFYGRLNTDALVSILPALERRGHLSEQTASELLRVISGSELSVTLYRNRLSDRYTHAGAISLEYDDCPEQMTRVHIHLLIKGLRSEINELCGSVAADGYRLIEAINPSYDPIIFERHTRNFVVKVAETEPAIDVCAGWDHEIQDGYLDAILHQNATLRTIEISIFCAEIGRAIGQTYISEVLRLPDQTLRSWFERAWLHDAIAEARNVITHMLSALNSFRIAA